MLSVALLHVLSESLDLAACNCSVSRACQCNNSVFSKYIMCIVPHSHLDDEVLDIVLPLVVGSHTDGGQVR